MFVQAVARARDAICAVVRLRRDDAGAVRVDVSGTAWAAGSPTTFVTAKHVVNPRPEGQRWYVVRRTSQCTPAAAYQRPSKPAALLASTATAAR